MEMFTLPPFCYMQQEELSEVNLSAEMKRNKTVMKKGGAIPGKMHGPKTSH